MALTSVAIIKPNAVPRGLSDPSFARNKRISIHRWVPWIAGFSADFVSDCLNAYAGAKPREATCVLDPFAGVGTTLIEGVLQGRNVYGFEINPYAVLATRVKLNADRVSEGKLAGHISAFQRFFERHCQNGNVSRTPRTLAPVGFSGRTQFFSPKVERKVLLALDYINSIEEPIIKDLFRLSLGSVMVSFSNYSYEPSLTRRVAVGKTPIEDSNVGDTVAAKLTTMLDDVVWLRDQTKVFSGRIEKKIFSETIFGATRRLRKTGFIDIVITSPPYLNNYHYPRNTRPQMHWLGLASGAGYKGAREGESFGKFWQTVRGLPQVDLTFALPQLQKTIVDIRPLNPEKGAYGGAGWANYVATYFNDAYRFCRVLSELLRPGGVAIIVLGNSVLQGVEVKTEHIFGRIGELNGLQFADTVVLRKKRTGSSIINSSVRVDAAPRRAVLYEAAIILRKKK